MGRQNGHPASSSMAKSSIWPRSRAVRPIAQHFCQQLPLAHQHRRAFRLACRDIGQRLYVAKSASMNPGGGSSQSLNVQTATLRRIAAEGGERRRGRPPVCPRASRDALSIVAVLIVSKPAIHTRQHLGRQLKMAVPLDRRDQDRHQRTQPLAADPVRRLPHSRLAPHAFFGHNPLFSLLRSGDSADICLSGE